ncbi:F-box only protein 40 [Amblyraja radiata]|uniref:F-box only protein 40 n=1 Tax=Amblyraja radiata TaxID=386614 RepID=UPI001402E0D9|nr:F-box only protein 40 [Amblyraja radiata]
MIRNQTLAPRLHTHCERCYSRHCKKSFEPSVSCLVVSCPSKCGALFHQCKENEHTLLCPLEHVPCINSGLGCPFSMARFKLGKHLRTCPASVVCCSMQWNRWPANQEDIMSVNNVAEESLNPENLDLGTAMRDQRIVFNSVRMAELFPEMAQAVGENDLDWKEPGLEGASLVASARLDGDHLVAELETHQNGTDNVTTDGAEPTQEEETADSEEGLYLSKYSAWEGIFSKDRGGCMGEEPTPKVVNKQKIEQADNMKKVTESNSSSPGVALSAAAEKTGQAPWQEGVLDRLKSQMDSKDFNIYLAHHGSMLIRFGQISACTPKDRDFVYGNLEAQEIITVNTFKLPTSYRINREHFIDRSSRKLENKSVDTSDLVTVSHQNDEVTISLLCNLEKILKGHTISETNKTDRLVKDVATQTYSFPSAPFGPDVVLADVASDKASCLYLQLHTECITKRYSKSASVFTFMCHHFFRRDEFSSHFKNVHADIQSSLNGWMVQKCPLAYLGCSYSQLRFAPSMQKARVIYNQQQSAFAIKPVVTAVLCNGDISVRRSGKNLLVLSHLPSEILRYIASFLDCYSLTQLSQVSVLMNGISSSLLQERGMVHLVWERKNYSHGSFSWRARKRRWQFSSVFSTIENWNFSDNPSIAEHLKTCSYYVTERRSNRVPLISLCKTQKLEQEKKSLTQMFNRKKAANRFSNLTL